MRRPCVWRNIILASEATCRQDTMYRHQRQKESCFHTMYHRTEQILIRCQPLCKYIRWCTDHTTEQSVLMPFTEASGTIPSWRGNGIGNYVNTNTWEWEVSGKRPAYYRIDEKGEIVCFSGRKAVRKKITSRHPKKPNSDFHEIKSCRNCQYSLYCKKNLKKKGRNRIFEINCEFLEEKKAFDNLLSAGGIEMRINRSIQIEGTFGIIIQDMRYERTRGCGMKKVGMEIMMTFLGLSIRKFIRFVTTGKNPDYWKTPEGL